MKAYFLRHEGYLGAIGAFHSTREPIAGSFQENFTKIEYISAHELNAVGTLDQLPDKLIRFPLLNPNYRYIADTFDISQPERSLYWINVLDQNLDKWVTLAMETQHFTEDAQERATKFAKIFRSHLSKLKEEPNAYGILSIRSLLALRESCLREVGFPDIFAEIKRRENHQALLELPNLLKRLDNKPEAEQLDDLILGVFAGTKMQVILYRKHV
jgi:type II pantothenate kinase